MIEYVNIFLSAFLNYVKALYNMSKDLILVQFRQHHWIEEESSVRGVTNTNSKVNVNNVKIGSSSKTNKHLMWIKAWMVLEEQLNGSQQWQVEFFVFPLRKERPLHLKM